MNKELQKSLKRYSAAAAAVIATGTAADAQIVYTQANKIITPTNPIDSIDINTDGTYDFAMELYDYAYSGVTITSVYGGPLNGQGHAMAAANGTASYYPLKLSAGDTINTQSFMTDDTGGYFAVLINGGPIPVPTKWQGGVVDGYLGVKLRFGANIHYGWVRMDINATCTQIIIKDMAYNNTPNALMIAGQGLSLDTYAEIANSVWATGKTIHSEVVAPYQKGSILVTDMTGKQVTSFELDHANQSFDASHLATGTYVLTIKLDEDSISKKVILH